MGWVATISARALKARLPTDWILGPEGHQSPPVEPKAPGDLAVVIDLFTNPRREEIAGTPANLGGEWIPFNGA